MRFSDRMKLLAILFVVAFCFLMPRAASAQDVAQGEVPYNSTTYKSSHNSYARDESLAQQIDDYNVWQIELDIYDFDGKLVVNHDCTPPFSGADTLQTLLQKMVNESSTFSRKFTMIYLDMKGNGNDSCHIGWGPTLTQRLKQAFIAILGQQHIYPASDFIAKDMSQWPSYQALARRGFNWGVIVDWHGDNPTTSDDLFFFATSSNPPDAGISANTVLVNIDGGCDAQPTSDVPELRNGRWIYRGYPGGACAESCDLQASGYWGNLLVKKYNYAATNCINREQTFAGFTQSPQPLFVSPLSRIACPGPASNCEWGTRAFPFHDLSAAVGRASPATTVLIEPGQYNVSGSARVLSHPLTLVVNGASSVVLN